MEEKLIFAAGGTKACRFAASYLQALGLPVTDTPGSRIRYLLLDVPSFQSNGLPRSGGSIGPILSALPKDIMICGGNLSKPALDGYETVDFLKDEGYLCENAYITAECALDVALPTVLLAFRFTTAFVAMTLVIAANALVGKLRGTPLFTFSLKGKNLVSLLALGIVQPVLYFGI